jgi:hypothetical protein
LVVVSIVVLLVASDSDDADSGSSTAVDVIKLLIGVLFPTRSSSSCHNTTP